MKIDLSKIDLENFIIKPAKIAGEMCFLIIPQHIGCAWRKETMIFRSSMWNSEGELISASFKKFFNWNEQPDLVPIPTDMKGISALQKIDGSALITSKYKGNLIVRTRGTTDASTLENGFEIEELKKKYPKAFEFEEETSSYSRIFEWTTPYNKIVLDYGNSSLLWLTGIINHSDYSYEKQDVLDRKAIELGLMRPKRYTFDSLTNMITSIEALKDEEGICAYFEKEQEIRKLKSLEYLKKHAFKSNATFENTLDLFLEFKCPSYQEFEKKLIETFDFECMIMVKGEMSKIIEGYKESQKILEHMKMFIEKEVKLLPSRKDQALKIFSAYGKESNRSSFCFQILDNKPINDDGIKKLIFQVTKNGK